MNDKPDTLIRLVVTTGLIVNGILILGIFAFAIILDWGVQ